MIKTRRHASLLSKNLVTIFFLSLLLGCTSSTISTRNLETEENHNPKLVLVTLDGVRWQEVFSGVDSTLMADSRFTKSPEAMKSLLWHSDRDIRRKKLFPFLWSKIAEEGVLVGDRTMGSYMEVANQWWFSYPGYNEILSGTTDTAIDSNDKNWNTNITFLESLNKTEEFRNKVMAFGSWDVFPYIINSQRSLVPVNAGFDTSVSSTTERSAWLRSIATQSPKLWQTVRLDFITHGFAIEALKSQKPQVLYIAYGETDDFAHDERYDRYIDAAHRTDQLLQDLWNVLQSDPFYRDQTTLIITTDHGRGNNPDDWAHHISPKGAIKAGIADRAPDGVVGSDHIWFAAIGPHIKARGIAAGQWKQEQIAATALATLGLDPKKLLPKAAVKMQGLLE